MHKNHHKGNSKGFTKAHQDLHNYSFYPIFKMSDIKVCQ